MDKVDCIVIGGGVVGLAIAANLCKKKINCIVLEAESSYGMGISSRNSEVIHAGIYYPNNSLKAKLCLKGKFMAYEYCRKYNIPYKKCGKFIVSTSSEDDYKLSEIKKNAERNGVTDLQLFSKDEIEKKEPNLVVSSGLYSPSTGIIDSHQFMTSLVHEIESNGGHVVMRSSVHEINIMDDGYKIKVKDMNTEYSIMSSALINSAGLNASKIAERVLGFPSELIPKTYMCKGTYYKYTGKSPFNHLIYPIPPSRAHGLGIHSTLDLNGNVKFGPDVEYVDNESYEINDKRDIFFNAITKYFPSLDKEKIIPDYCGIRPKLQGPDDNFKDFMIMDYKDYGFSNLIQLFGIESPGLTSSLAIADHVCSMLTK